MVKELQLVLFNRMINESLKVPKIFQTIFKIHEEEIKHAL
jgi:hypothetical protein